MNCTAITFIVNEITHRRNGGNVGNDGLRTVKNHLEYTSFYFKTNNILMSNSNGLALTKSAREEEEEGVNEEMRREFNKRNSANKCSLCGNSLCAQLYRGADYTHRIAVCWHFCMKWIDK